MNDERHLIFVVDDDLAVRESLKFALELEGLRVHACSGATDLFAYPNLANASCVIVDFQMPVMNGLEVVLELRARSCFAPVILITGHTNRALHRRADAAGVRHIIEKPLLDSALIESIHEVLRG